MNDPKPNPVVVRPYWEAKGAPRCNRRTCHGVLVIEDRASIRALLCGLFTMLGFDAQPACDGVEALGWLKQAPYDLVVTDLTMPGASGWDVIAAVRCHAPGTPVIIVTGTAVSRERFPHAAYSPVEITGGNVKVLP